jgi:ABC-type glycerol-3-phosphate transport system substrate-binding protein
MPKYISFILKKVILLLMALNLLASLVSCRSATSLPSPTLITRQSVPEEGNVLITFAGYTAQRSLYEPMMEEFHRQHPEINVQFVELPTASGGTGSNNSKYLRELANSADTVIFTSEDSRNAGSFFKDMQSLMNADPTFQPQDFWQGALSACQDSHGSLLGIPLTIGLHGIFYDQQAFARVDLTPPQPGWTWDDFRRDVTALASLQSGSSRYGFADNNGTYTSVLGPIVDAYLVNKVGKVEAGVLPSQIQWYFDLANAKKLYPLQDSSSNNAERTALFQSDNPPAMWTGYLATPLPRGGGTTTSSDPWTGMALSTLGFVPFPADNETSHTTPAYTTCAAISAGTSHSQAAWAWISFLSRQWVFQPELGAYGIAQTPARKSVAEAVDYWNKLPEKAIPAVRYGLEHAWFGPLYPQEFGAVQTAIVQTLEGKSDFAAALAKAQSSSGPEATLETTEVVVATTQPPPAPDQDTITYFMDNSSFSEQERYAVKTLAEAFNRDHPGMAVNVVSDYVDGDLITGMAKKSDCFTTYSWYIDLYQPHEGSLLSLDALVDTEDPAFLKDYSPALLDADRIEGKLYALPAELDPPVILYNATLLAKRGLQPPAVNWTFNDFVNMITLAASTSEVDKSYGFLWGFDDRFFRGRGVKWIDLESNPPVIKIDSPDMVSTLAWLVGLSRSRALLPKDENNDVMSGRIAFWSTVVGRDPDSLNWGVSYQWGMVPYPSMLASTILFQQDEVKSHFISKTSKNPQVCWEWIKYLSEHPEVFQGVPARQSMATSPVWESKVGKARAEVYRQALAQIGKQSEPSEVQDSVTLWIQGWLNDAVEKALTGSMDPQQALTEAQIKAVTFLACMQDAGYKNLKGKNLSRITSPCFAKADPAIP